MIFSVSGVTKHIYDREIIDINVMWNNQLKKIEKEKKKEKKKSH